MRRQLCAALLICVAPLNVLYAAPPNAANHPDAGAAIDACIPRLDPELDVGYERISALCPDLARTLEQSDFAQWLPQGWKESRNNLSAGSLAELRSLVAREQATRATARTPRVDHLNQVLVTLGDQRAHSLGVWSRFKKWLRELTERPEGMEKESWFDRMVSRVGISNALMEVIQYIALGVMVILALIVVMNELRAAGLLGRRSRRVGGADATDVPSTRRPPELVEIERAALAQRPGMLLELISARLTALRRLPPATALTVRELTRSADLQDAQDSERLTRLALTAERARYSDGDVPPDSLTAAFDQGRELLRHVEALRAPESAPVGGATS